MKRSWVCLLFLGMFIFTAGALQKTLYRLRDAEQLAYFFLVLPYAIFLRLWLSADSRERCVRIPDGAAILVPMLTIVGVPYYLARTRTWRTAAWQSVIAVLIQYVAGWMYWAGQSVVYLMQVRHR